MIHRKTIAAILMLGGIAACGAPGELEIDGALVSIPQELMSPGAKALPNIGYASVLPTLVFHVAITGNDANEGSALKPWRTIAHAVNMLRPGEAAYVHAGTYAGHIQMAARDGLATAPIFLMGAPGEPKPVLLASADSPVLRISRSYWIIDGLDVNANGRQAHGIRIDGASNVTVRNTWVHSGIGPGAVAVSGTTKDVYLFRNKVYGYTWTVNGARRDSHGFIVVPDAQRVWVRQNEAYGNSGDGLQCAGVSEVGFGAQNPTDLTIEDNRFHHNTENAVDIKSCTRVTIRGGDADGSKFYGHRTADDTGTRCAGAAVVVHFNASDILVERNRIWDNGMGIALGRDDALVKDVVIRHNLFFGLTQEKNGCGDAVRIGRARNVLIANNTFDGIPRSAIRVGADNVGTLSENVTVLNNIVRDAVNALEVYRKAAPNFQTDRNLYWRSDTRPTVLRMDLVTQTLAAWQSTSGKDTSSLVADPQFLADPKASDYYTRSNSPARDRAVVLNTTAPCDAGPDLGFLESCVPL